MSLLEIQQKLKAPKSQFNSFGKYNYRNCEDILEALKPLLAEHKYQLTISDDVVEVGGRVYVKATVTLYGKDEHKVSQTTAFAREAESKKGMDTSQVTGATSSYARKYALNGMFLIDDTKDADSDKPPKKEKTEKKQPPPLESPFPKPGDEEKTITAKQVGFFQKKLREYGYSWKDDATAAEVRRLLQTSSLPKTTPYMFKRAIDNWGGFIDNLNAAGLKNHKADE